MAPNQRDPSKASVSAWLPREMKAELAKRAKEEGISLADAVERAVEEWLQKSGDETPRREV